MISLVICLEIALVLIVGLKGWLGILSAIFVLAAGLVVFFDGLHGWSRNLIDEVEFGLRKTNPKLIRLARWLIGPKRGLIYLYPGGRLGAPIARALTIIALILVVFMMPAALCYHWYYGP